MFELFIALGAGLISFLSPCVLPLIPGYISYISGSSLNELIEKRNLLRDQGNYNDADKIRSQLDELGIILEDKDGKTSWKQKN